MLFLSWEHPVKCGMCFLRTMSSSMPSAPTQLSSPLENDQIAGLDGFPQLAKSQSCLVDRRLGF